MNTPKIYMSGRKVRQFTRSVRFFMTALTLVSGCASRALAQEGHTHSLSPQAQESNVNRKAEASALIKIVRESTERFKDVSVAKAEGYVLQFGCVSGPDAGAMGLHYVNASLVGAGVLDATHPQIVIYEPNSDGSLRLTGADYLLFADSWNAKNSAPPELMGQLFHLFESPNRFGLPAFYTLHVWAWKENPNGAFVNWHPHVSCEAFAGNNP